MPVEPISLSIGVVALASLFSTCVECFDLLDAGREFGRDYELLIIQLQLEKTRLLDRGQSVGLLQIEGVQRPVDLDSPVSRPVVEQALNAIHLLWTDSDQLISRYGLEESKSDRLDLIMKPRVGSTANAWFNDSWEGFQAKTDANRCQTPLIKKARWALNDRAKFKTLVDNLRNLIDALLAVTKTPGTAGQRYQLMREEIRSIQDTTVLSLLAENTSEVDRDWSDAASDALETSILGEQERVYNWLDRAGSNRLSASFLTNEEHETRMELSQKVTVNLLLVIVRSKLCRSLEAIMEILRKDPIHSTVKSGEHRFDIIRKETKNMLPLLQQMIVLSPTIGHDSSATKNLLPLLNQIAALAHAIEHDWNVSNIHHLSMVLVKSSNVYGQILVKS